MAGAGWVNRQKELYTKEIASIPSFQVHSRHLLKLIHDNIWQKPLQYCKVISLQLIKINEKN